MTASTAATQEPGRTNQQEPLVDDGRIAAKQRSTQEITDMAHTISPGTVTWDSDIEEYVLIDAFGNAFYGATTQECHTASRDASRVRLDHARHDPDYAEAYQEARELYEFASGR